MFAEIVASVRKVVTGEIDLMGSKNVDQNYVMLTACRSLSPFVKSTCKVIKSTSLYNEHKSKKHDPTVECKRQAHKSTNHNSYQCGTKTRKQKVLN